MAEVRDEVLFDDLGSVRRVSSSWAGLENLTQLFIFGDSYSDNGWRLPHFGGFPLPSPEAPLGIPWPGCIPFFQLPGEAEPNWVAHFSEKHVAEGQDLLVYDFAVAGNSVNEVVGPQFQRGYQALLHESSFSVVARLSLSLIWIGINDVCFPNRIPANEVGKIRRLLVELHTSGLRNFILVDAPPRMREDLEPGEAPSPSYQRHHARIDEWNLALSNLADEFARSNEDATVLTFSAHRLFGRMLSEPAAFGFAPDDPSEMVGGIWEDGLHPTTKVHAHVAKGLASFLASVPAPAAA